MQGQHVTKTNHAVREAHQIHLEESFFPRIQSGKMTQSTAHYLASHPDVLAKWKEDAEAESRFNF